MTVARHALPAPDPGALFDALWSASLARACARVETAETRLRDLRALVSGHHRDRIARLRAAQEMNEREEQRWLEESAG